ncbi:MAG: sigma-70 family RNA polymerase sigma factor [Deltaproteobacteria bacterium]|nr:sigma-70 family RNA polymerase sigma factor [Deltaproteobacteria bacterium]
MTDCVGDGPQQHVGGHAPEAVSGRRGPTSTHAPATLELEDVYSQYSGFVWRIVRRMGIPEASVEDVMHEVFLVVHRRLGDYDGRVAMTTWLYHQTRGVVSNHRRSRRREQRRLQLVDPQPAAAPDPEAHTRRGQAAAFVQRFLADLDPQKREIFELCEVEGLAMPEVADLLGIKLNTAYSRLRAARQLFQRAVTRLRAADDGRASLRSRTA